MKTTRLYLQSSHFWWYCTKCGKPNFLKIEPQGVFDYDGKRLAGKKAFKKALVVHCDRKHLGVPNCEARRKVFIAKAIFKHMTDKFCQKMKRKNAESLRKEDAERNKNHEKEIRKRVIEELKKEKKEKRRQKKLAEKSKKKKKKGKKK